MCRWYHSDGRKWRGTKELLDEGKRGEWESWLNSTFKTLRSWHLVPTFHGIFCCSFTKSCLTLCSPTDCSTPGSPVLHHLPEFSQTHVYWVCNATQPSHSLLYPFPPTFGCSQIQGLSQTFGSLDQVTNILELQLQHQSFQWIFRVDFF